MKKQLFVLGLAVAALASCTNEEVTDIADSNVIGFKTFVGNTTKASVAEVTTDNIKAFHVYGTKDGGATSAFFNGDQVYESETPNTWIYDNLQLWETGKTYTFAAYSNGGTKDAASTTSTVAWNGSALTITDYAGGTEQKDLLVAIASNVSAVASSNAPVEFTFNHALAMIKFTINSKLGDDDNAIAISNFKVTGINGTADLSYSSNTCTWSNWDTPVELSSTDFTTTSSKAGESDSFVVIPGESNVGFTVTFTATIGDGTVPAKNLKATISNQQWTAGLRYNYTATITGEDMDVITFADPTVTPWTDNSTPIDAGNLTDAN